MSQRRNPSTLTLPETVHELDDVLREYHRLSRLTLSTMQHLISEQADAVARRSGTFDAVVSGGGDDPEYGSPHDVMLARMAALAPYGYRGRQITSAIGTVRRSLRDWQHAIDEALSDRPPKTDEDRPRCPGTSDDADGRLGGCGNLTERYNEGGVVKYRPLCRSCRSGSARASSHA